MSENISLDGSEDQPQVNQVDNDFSAHYGKVVPSDITNNASILDAILNAPQEQLIPWEECCLPSKGLYYGWPDGVVQVKAMGQTAEKVLATQRLAATGQSIDYLFKECCRFPNGFDPVDLLLGDRVYLLYFLRGITYGNLYEFSVTCPDANCAVMSMHTYDLNELNSTVIPADPDLGPEPFKIHLPYMSNMTGADVWVEIRYLRAGDANAILSKRKNTKSIAKSTKRNPFDRKNKVEELDEAVTENLEKVIVSVLGSTDTFKIKAFVQRLHAQDTSAIREWMKDNTPGIDSSIQIECPSCNQEFSIELPITDTFFRPSKS